MQHMRTQHRFFVAALAFAALLGGCGGGGSSVPAALPGSTAIQPQINAGVIAATGPLTLMSGSSIIGSTILPSSTAAIFTIDSGATPKEIAPGATLATSAVVISDVLGQSIAATTRRAAARTKVVTTRDFDVRIPDAPNREQMASLIRLLARRSSDVSRRPSRVIRPQAFGVGDRKIFALQGGTINGSGGAATPIPMPATLVAQSSHANVWLDDAVYRNGAVLATEYPTGMSDFTTVASDFESIFAIETQAFGPAYTTGNVNFQECDANGTALASEPPRPDTTGADPHINIVITDRLKGSGEGGYFYGLDLLNQFEANCAGGPLKPTVNGLPMLVIGSDAYPAYTGAAAQTYPPNNEAYWLHGDMPQTIAHEFQHYLHFINKYLQQHIDHPNDPNAGTLDDAFIDEGCSVLAQDLAAGSAVSGRESPVFVRAFLLEPNNFSLTAFTGYQPNILDSSSANPPYGYYRNTAGNYGYAYLFVRYLYDRFGPAALKAMYAETNFGGAAQPDTGPATAAAGGESFAQLFREFTAALATHSGGAVAEMSHDPAFAFDASVILRGATQTYSRRLPPYDVRNIVQPGPLNPETFAGNVPSGYVEIAPGESVNLTLMDGAALFISPILGSSSGSTLRATIPPAGGGSLGQGPMPMPSPAYY